MKVDCEGCAGCCIDWRPLTDQDVDHERRGRFQPLDDTYNLAPLRRDEVRAFVDAGYGDALQPRLFAAESGEGEEGAQDASVTIDGVDVAAVGGRPVFYVGLRKPPKPVGPFGRGTRWLDTCVFLDPTTLQCRIHGDDLYPRTCGEYPGENLALDVETECERVEQNFGESFGERLLDDEPPADVEPLFGPTALGTKVFAHPDPERLAGVVSRLRDEGLTTDDRAEFVAVAVASSPATLAVNDPVYEQTREDVLAADSWAGGAIAEWADRAGETGAAAPPPDVASAVEDERGAPGTPGWDAVRSDY